MLFILLSKMNSNSSLSSCRRDCSWIQHVAAPCAVAKSSNCANFWDSSALTCRPSCHKLWFGCENSLEGLHWGRKHTLHHHLISRRCICEGHTPVPHHPWVGAGPSLEFCYHRFGWQLQGKMFSAKLGCCYRAVDTSKWCAIDLFACQRLARVLLCFGITSALFPVNTRFIISWILYTARRHAK